MHGLSKQQLEAMAIQHCPMLEWGGIMLEALAIQHCPMSEWGGFMVEAMAIQHYPMFEWAVLCWRQWQFNIVHGPMCAL